MTTAYDDIIHLPHHVSSKRPQMPMSDRAAQFSPFAALTGYDDAIQETGRLTEQKIELDEEALQMPCCANGGWTSPCSHGFCQCEIRPCSNLLSCILGILILKKKNEIAASK